jgi:dihydrofolate reductase
MANGKPRVTIHMAASLDGFIARKDGGVDWMETSDTFEGGHTLTPESIEAFLKTIDCYVMGSRTYETALGFEARGLGWAYGDTPTFVLTHRVLPRTRNNVEFYAGDLKRLVGERLMPLYASIWFVGGGEVCAECLRLQLADDVRYSILPILIWRRHFVLPGAGQGRRAAPSGGHGLQERNGSAALRGAEVASQSPSIIQAFMSQVMRDGLADHGGAAYPTKSNRPTPPSSWMAPKPPRQLPRGLVQTIIEARERRAEPRSSRDLGERCQVDVRWRMRVDCEVRS